MTRHLHRHVVPVDDCQHEFTLTGGPLAVAAAADARSVEFWTEHDPEAGRADRAFRVFGTGQPLPPEARWAGTCQRVRGLVWHLYEMPPGPARGDAP